MRVSQMIQQELTWLPSSKTTIRLWTTTVSLKSFVISTEQPKVRVQASETLLVFLFAYYLFVCLLLFLLLLLFSGFKRDFQEYFHVHDFIDISFVLRWLSREIYHRAPYIQRELEKETLLISLKISLLTFTSMSIVKS